MEYIFRHPTSLKHYTADAFVVRCFDDRYWKTFKAFLKSLGIRHMDPVSLAGGATALAAPEKEEDREFVLRQLEKSIQLHHTSRVMLFTHSDCGALGGMAHFQNNTEEEFQFHQELHRKAVETIRIRFPNLLIETFFLDQQGIIKTTP